MTGYNCSYNATLGGPKLCSGEFRRFYVLMIQWMEAILYPQSTAIAVVAAAQGGADDNIASEC